MYRAFVEAAMPHVAVLSAGLVPMDGPGTYLGWGWFNVSLGNFIVIVLMLAAFVAALLVPFPRGKK
jgi:hypothetical protein